MPLFSQAVKNAAAGFTPPALPPVQGIGNDDVLRASQALTVDHTISLPGMERPFLGHQAPAYLYAVDAIKRWGCAFLGDDMGLGKTQVMLALANDFLSGRGSYAVLVGPPVALATYQAELATSFPGLTLAHLHGHKRYLAPQADIYFLSDDARTLQAWLTDGVITTEGFDKGNLIPSTLAKGAAIFLRDEIHRDKGNQGKPNGRAKVSLLMGQTMRAAGRPVVAATGTLLTNRPVEGFIPLKIAGGDALVMAVSPGARTVGHYLFKYCAPETSAYGTTFNGVELAKMAELHEMLRRTVYCRREKADLGDTLPHGGWIVSPLALNNLTRYERLEKEFLDLILEEEGPEAVWRKSRAEAIVRMQKLWEEAGVAKAPAVADYTADLVDQGKKVILFFHHTRVRDELAKHLLRRKINITLIDGSVKGSDRKEAEAAIQTGDAQVMLAQINAAGIAVTLTAASEAVFDQVPWSAGALSQCAGRVLRADQISIDRALRGEGVNFHVPQACYPNGDPTFDSAMWSILEGKAKVCDAVNAGREITLPDESVTKQVLNAWFNQRRHTSR